MKIRNITQIDRGVCAHVCPLCGEIHASAPEPDMMPEFSICRCDMMPGGEPRFLLEKSKDNAGWWVLSDRLNLVVIRFKERQFNETQRVSFLSDEMDRHPDVREIPRILREMADWLVIRHRSVATNEPHGMEIDDDGRTVVYRGKFPRWRLTVEDGGASAGQIGSSMAKAAAFLRSLEVRRRMDGGSGDVF